MCSYTTLNNIELGKKAIINDILLNGDIKRRLLDIGLIEGTCIENILESPFKDPKAYLIRGAIIALRSEETKKIIVKAI